MVPWSATVSGAVNISNTSNYTLSDYILTRRMYKLIFFFVRVDETDMIENIAAYISSRFQNSAVIEDIKGSYPKPRFDEDLQIFCKYAFNQKTPEDGFDELAREITYHVGELPLGLKVIGSHFRGLSKEQWPMEVSRLRTYRNGDIERILKFSYDALCDEDKDLFLHIACFFNMEKITKVKELFGHRFKDLRQSLHILEMKSLISIEHTDLEDSEYYESINMRNLLVQLGQEIVRKESVLEPGQRRFLIDYKDICAVVSGHTTITGSVVGIDSKNWLSITEKSFKGMSNLQFLRVKNDLYHPNIISSPGPLTFISPKLRLLDWSCFPMTSLRFINNLEFLVELRMCYSKLEKLWDGIQLVRNLKHMDLTDSRNLKELPNLSMATNLKNLNLERCSSLVELPSSIGNATSLHDLRLFKCSSLVELPFSIGNLTNLWKLDLRECSSLVSLPQLPDSIMVLNARNCESLEKLDCSFYNPGILLNFVNCFNLNQEARDLLIETSTVNFVVLPGKEVPACFTYRSHGSSVSVKVNQKLLHTSTKFKACILFENEVDNETYYFDLDTLCVYTKTNKDCILLDNKGEDDEVGIQKRGLVSCRIGSEWRFSEWYPFITDHLYIFEVEAKEVTSTELIFYFEIFDEYSKAREIKECGIIHLLEHHVDDEEKMDTIEKEPKSEIFKNFEVAIDISKCVKSRKRIGARTNLDAKEICETIQ
ncbi:disease resistance protein RPP1-WsA, putative [Arabidopsis thaliana]|uniref:Disease resistance protein RPP1-WsA, putative n=1 Tax=Arabidopsis thaliana TaxID=3702 RepID=Q9FVT7_ARATH|nr:disease resistance protein RPP1-WsA, putative [Arabidopsis thaliana]